MAEARIAETAIAREIKQRSQRFQSQTASEKHLLAQLESSASKDEKVTCVPQTCCQALISVQ